MNLTYRQLAEAINAMSPEWKDANVTVYNPEIDECYPVSSVEISSKDVATALDEGHPVLQLAMI